MANGNQGKDVSYTKTAVYRPLVDGHACGLSECVMMVEGFAKRLRVRTVNTRKGDQKVADLTLTALISDKRTEWLFGPEMVNHEYHSVNFRVTYWGQAATTLEKYPPQKDQKILCLIRDMKINVFEGDTATIRTVDATGVDFPQMNSAKKEGRETLAPVADGNSGGGNTSRNGGAGAGQQSNATVIPSSDGYADFDAILEDDEELPF